MRIVGKEITVGKAGAYQRKEKPMTENENYRKFIARPLLLTSPHFERLLSDVKCCEYILRTLFRRDDIHVIESEIMLMTLLRPDSMWVQVKAKNNDGEPVSFGLQLESEFMEDMRVVLDELVKRTKDSHECYAVSFEQVDVLRLNNPMHVLNMCIKRKNGMFKGPSLAYVNVNATEEPYKSLFDDLKCNDPKKMRNEIIADAVRKMKF